MAEEQAAEEQTGDPESREEDSTLGRVKNRIKELAGKDSGNGDSGEREDASAEGSSDDGQDGDASTEQQDDSGEGAQAEGDSDEMVGDFKVDEVDMDRRSKDDDEARAQIMKLEKEGPPENLGDWPTGKAMYLSFGGAEGEEGYEEGPARQMGPSSLRHLADGSVEVQGEIVDDASPYKGEQSVTEETEELGMDKGAKSDKEEGDSGGEESSSDDSQAEGSDDASAEGGDSQAEGSGDGAEAEGNEESEAAERS